MFIFTAFQVLKEYYLLYYNMINKNLKKSETKVLREQLKNEVDSQLTDIKEILHKRTFNKYTA